MAREIEAAWEDPRELDLFDQEVEVGFGAAHAPWVEYGTDPHRVSQEGWDNIRSWVKRKAYAKIKLGSNYYKAGRRVKLRYTDEDEKEIDRITDAIVWSIRKNGTDAHPFLRPAVDEANRKLTRLLGENYDMKDVADYILGLATENINRKGIADRGTLAQSGYVQVIRGKRP